MRSVVTGVLQRGNGAGNKAQEKQRMFFKPLPMHLLSPTESPTLLWGLGPEWKGREKKEGKSIPPALKRNEFGFASRPLSPRLPSSHLQGEALYGQEHPSRNGTVGSAPFQGSLLLHHGQLCLHLQGRHGFPFTRQEAEGDRDSQSATVLLGKHG